MVTHHHQKAPGASPGAAASLSPLPAEHRLGAGLAGHVERVHQVVGRHLAEELRHLLVRFWGQQRLKRVRYGGPITIDTTIDTQTLKRTFTLRLFTVYILRTSDGF